MVLVELCYHPGYRFKSLFSWSQKHLLAEHLKVVPDGHFATGHLLVLDHRGEEGAGVRTQGQQELASLQPPPLPRT